MTPAFKIVIDGRQDTTEAVRDRLLSLSVTDEAGRQSDSAEVRLDNRDGAIANDRAIRPDSDLVAADRSRCHAKPKLGRYPGRGSIGRATT